MHRLHLPPIFGPGLFDGVIKISPLPIPIAMATNFGTKMTNSAPVKDNCALFAPTSYFQAQAIRWCHSNFSPSNPCCHVNEFCDKIDYNSAPVKDNCTVCTYPPYTHIDYIAWQWDKYLVPQNGFLVISFIFLPFQCGLCAAGFGNF